MRLFVDDLRDPREWLPGMRWYREHPSDLGEWVWVKTASETIRLLEREGITEMSLDFDLGDRDDVGDGNDVAVWIEERVALDENYVPPILHVHSSNVGGRERLEAAVASIERLVARRGR